MELLLSGQKKVQKRKYEVKRTISANRGGQNNCDAPTDQKMEKTHFALADYLNFLVQKDKTGSI